MMSKIKLMPLLILIATVWLTSCNNDESSTLHLSNGAFILNEGAFGNTNASVSFLSSNGKIINDVFNLVNKRPVGDALQSAAIDNGKMYMVLNGSGKVEVVNSDLFTQIYTIEGLNNPRCILATDNKLYVTQWNSWGEEGAVKVFDQSSYSLNKTIDLGFGPEGLVACSGKIWVANGGGYLLDSTIMAINPTTNEIEDTIVVGHNPKELVTDKNGNIWVICYGYIEYDDSWNVARETPSKLVEINTTSMEVEKTFTISYTQHPSHIDVSPDGESIYYGGGYGVSGIYRVGISDGQLPSTPIVDDYFYGFNINPGNGNIYGLIAPNFSGAGMLNVYDADGIKLNEYEVGIAPSTAIFN